MAVDPPHKYAAGQFLEALQLTGRLLDERGESFEIVVIGGANLAIQELVDRLTVDVDVVAVRSIGEFECAQPLPATLVAAVEDVADVLRLPKRWMNGTASSDFELGLPCGCESRLHVVTYGGLTVSFADRTDMIAWKLQAAVDNIGLHDRHLEDLKVLQPNTDEVNSARQWFESVEGPDSGFWTNLKVVLEVLDCA
jgi:hypothetical protein